MSSLRKFRDLENIKNERDVKNFLMKCQDKDIPLYYKVPPAHHIWLRIWWSQNGRFSQSLNINISIEKDLSVNWPFLIQLDEMLISDLIGFSYANFFSSSKVFYYHFNNLKKIIDIPIAELWKNKVESDRGNLINLVGFDPVNSFMKCLFSPSEHESYSKKTGSNKPMEEFYFKDVCNEKETDIYEPKEFRISVDDIYLLDEDLDKLFKLPTLPGFEDMNKDSPYNIVKYYPDYEVLCKLARIGFVIFEMKPTETQDLNENDGALMLERYGLFKRKPTPGLPTKRASKDARTAYSLISMNYRRKNGEEKLENPLIQYLKNIPLKEDVGYSRVKDEVVALKYNIDQEKLVLKLLKKNEKQLFGQR